MGPLSHCVFAFVCLCMCRPTCLLGVSLILKMVRMHVSGGGGAPYLMGCMVNVCLFVCVFYLMGCLWSDIIGRQGVKGGEKTKFLGGRMNLTCALYIMRPYGAHCAAGAAPHHSSVESLGSHCSPPSLSPSLSSALSG